MRCFRLPNSHFSFTEESILKFVSLKARNLVSLPPGGTREAENGSHICGGGASLQVSNISVGFQPCR